MKPKLIDLIPNQVKKLSKKRKNVLKKSAERLGIEIGGGIIEYTYPGLIDPSFTVWILDKKDSEEWNNLFEQLGMAFILGDRKRIIIDASYVYKKSFTKHHLLAIEAHEICHHFFKHHKITNPKYDSLCEMEADAGAMYILKELGELEATKIIEKRYKVLYENDGQIKLNREINKKLDIYIKRIKNAERNS